MSEVKVLVPVRSPREVEPLEDRVSKSYLNALKQAGASPVLLQATQDAPVLDQYKQLLLGEHTGLLLTGGGDVDPSRYGESAHDKVYGVDHARDAVELNLVQRAVELGVPIFAICRGIQVLNVALGGTLVQDLPSQGYEGHWGDSDKRGEPVHDVVVVQPESCLAEILKVERVKVNSFHHQAIKALGRGLVVTARSPDGVIEAVELEGKPFVLGVQWHPEDMPEMIALFRAFVQACQERGECCAEPARSPRA